MVTLVSPGVSVTVVDESAYGAPGAGTIPLLVLATRENKTDPTGSETDGIARYTKSTYAGDVVRVTSQRELTQYFGNPTFTTSGTTVVQGSETSEYGLLAAYSYLGQGSQAYIVRADVDLAQLEATTTAPTAAYSTANSLWLDTDASNYGIHKYNSTTGLWVAQTPVIEVNDNATALEAAGGSYTPSTTVTVGQFLVAVHARQTGDLSLEYFIGRTGTAVSPTTAAAGASGTATLTFAPQAIAPFQVGEQITVAGVTPLGYNGTFTVTACTTTTVSYVNATTGVQTVAGTVTAVAAAWEELDSDAVLSTGDTVTWARHFSTPAAPGDGDIWIKTTSPGNGINLVVSEFTTAWVSKTVQGVTTAQTALASTSIGDFFPQDGSSTTALTSSTATSGRLLLDLDVNTKALVIVQRVTSVGGVSTLSNYTTKFAQTSTPTATAATGQLWFDNTINSLDIYKVNSGVYDAVTPTYSTTAPTSPSGGDVWVDTTNAADGQANERSYPVIKVYSSALTAWVTHSNTDQSTNRGVLFANISDTAGNASTLITGAPDPLVYPNGMIVVNMAQSKNTVREWNGTAWRNAAPNHADGSGRFGRYAQKAVIAQAMQAAASGTDLRDEQYTFSLLCAPNYPELTDELVTLNSDRGETAFIIIDTPMRKNPTEAVLWVQNNAVATENGEDGLVTNNTYSAVYYPAGNTTEPVNGNTVVVPPSHMALYTYAYNDNISFQWFAPAGTTRGVVQNASAVGYVTSEGEFKAVALTQGQRDSMYQNSLNPIATFVGQGTIIFGQKTLHVGTSALDRVNVARLVAYLRGRFDSIARPFLFEQNDTQTRERAKLVFERFLADILSRRGIYDFAVVCDETNNTPARIDRNELYIDVAIEPAKAVEFIYIPIRIVNTGTLAGTV